MTEKTLISLDKTSLMCPNNYCRHYVYLYFYSDGSASWLCVECGFREEALFPTSSRLFGHVAIGPELCEAESC